MMGTPHSKSHTQKKKSITSDKSSLTDEGHIKKYVAENIAAIDFGTTSLTLSYSTKGDDEAVKTFQFSNGIDKDVRIPNAILIRRGDDGKCVVKGLGKHARESFRKASPEERPMLIYFERIKMLLKRDAKNINRQAQVESFTGEPFYLIEVIAFILKSIALQLQEHLSRTVLPLKKNDFDWVITVPAIWDAQSKRMMREAAFLSGMLTDKEGITQLTQFGSGITQPEEENPEKLSLALEPECAAIYSQITSKSDADQYIQAAASKSEADNIVTNLSKGYMVIDAGGGTVDITAQLEEEGGVKVVTVPVGNALGGIVINEKFSLKFQDIVGDKGFYGFLNDGNNDVSRILVRDKFLYEEFESQKVTFGRICHTMKSDEVAMRIAVPAKMVNFYKEERILEGISQANGYTFEDDDIRITKEAAEELFSESITDLISHTFKALDTVKNGEIGTIYLVGGFGSSNLVENCVKKVINDRSLEIKVIVPSSPTLAIATGAVMLRKNPAFIKARLADATYGIAIKEIFDPKRHELAYKTYDESDKQYYCRDIFDVFLKEGEPISCGKEFTTSLYASDGAEEVKLVIYSTTKKNIKYVRKADGKPLANLLGQLIIDVPNPNNLPWRDRRVDITLNFSGSEIKAGAVYSVTKKEAKTVCDFL